MAAAMAMAALTIIATPAFAQDNAHEAEVMEAMMAMFAAEPLTPEQEARLPLASEVVRMMLPEGAMKTMMGGMFDSFLGPLMESAGSDPRAVVKKHLGTDWLDLEDDQAAQVAAILDPAWQERQEREKAMLPEIMGQVMGALEPAMRKAMSEVYAVYFDEAQLKDIRSFFATPTGTAFAQQSMTISSDPRLIGAMMQEMPTMMGALAAMDVQMKAASADLPAPKSYGDLSAVQRAALAELTGLSQSELAEYMAAAAAEAEQISPFE